MKPTYEVVWGKVPDNYTYAHNQDLGNYIIIVYGSNALNRLSPVCCAAISGIRNIAELISPFVLFLFAKRKRTPLECFRQKDLMGLGGPTGWRFRGVSGNVNK